MNRFAQHFSPLELFAFAPAGNELGRHEPGHLEFSWTNMPTGIGVFILIAAIAAVLYFVFYLYRREIETCSPTTKLVLATLRSITLITLAVIFLGPALIRVNTRTVHPVITVLRDASLSMNTSDRYLDSAAATSTAALLGKTAAEVSEQRPTRVKVLAEIMQHNDQQLLRGLAKKGRVRIVDFAQESNLVETLSASTLKEESTNTEAKQPSATALFALPELKAEGRGTDLAAAISEAVEADNPAAIIIYSDGQHTGKDDPREAAREARQRGVPLLVVGIGDASRPRDLRMANVYVRPQIWSEEPFEVEAVVVGQGIEGGEANLELIEKRVSDTDSSTSAGTVVARQSVTIPAGGGSITTQFSHTVKEVGKYVYAVRVEPVADEISEADNVLDSQQVKVLSREKIRVLLVAGAPTWEFRMVEKLLQREKSMVVSCWLQTLDEGRAQEGTRPITHLPTNKEELFWYDIVLMFDPNPKELDREWMDLLKQFIGDHAGGMLFMAGPKFTSTLLTNTRTSEIKKLLPVTFGDVGAMEVASLLSVNSQSWPLRVSPAGMDHPVMTFYSDRKQTLQRWETLPGIYWSFPSSDAKPTAQVLVEHSDPTLRSVEGARPLMVAGRYGAGQVLYLGFNGTWRWRKAGNQAEFFDKFWVQAVRHLVESRSLEGRRRGSLQTDHDRYEIGEKVSVTARLQDASYQPLVAERVEATFQVESDASIPLTLLPLANQPGTFETAFVPRKPGKHVLKLRIPGAAAEDSLLEAPFQVELPSVETSQVWLNKPLLSDLAALSAEGGKYLEVNQIAELLASVPDKTETLESRSKPEPLWDIPQVLWFLVAVLALEWWIRKQNKLL